MAYTFAVCVANGYISSYYNVPHFPEYCGESTMDDKTVYDTLVRIGGSWRGMGTAFAYIVQTYGWRRLMLLTDTASTQCLNGGTAINAQVIWNIFQSTAFCFMSGVIVPPYTVSSQSQC
jgi:hypothetical protein